MLVFFIMVIISVTLITMVIIKSSSIADEKRRKKQEQFIDKYGNNIIDIVKEINNNNTLDLSKYDSLSKLENGIVEYTIQKIELITDDKEFSSYIDEFKKFGELENLITSTIYRNYTVILELYRKTKNYV